MLKFLLEAIDLPLITTMGVSNKVSAENDAEASPDAPLTPDEVSMIAADVKLKIKQFESLYVAASLLPYSAAETIVQDMIMRMNHRAFSHLDPRSPVTCDLMGERVEGWGTCHLVGCLSPVPLHLAPPKQQLTFGTLLWSQTTSRSHDRTMRTPLLRSESCPPLLVL